MNRPDLFERSVDRLITAYLQGNLEAGDPCGCAVGTICGHGKWHMGLSAYRHEDKDVPSDILPRLPYENEEVDRIERAFEHPSHSQSWPDTFVRLVSTVEELLSIHDAEETVENDIRDDLLSQVSR